MEKPQNETSTAFDLYLAREHLRDYQTRGAPHHLRAARSIIERLSRSLASDAGSTAPVVSSSVGDNGEDARAPIVGTALLQFLATTGLTLDQQYTALAGAQLTIVRRIAASGGGAF